MMSEKTKAAFTSVLGEIKESGLYKNERVLFSPQGSDIVIAGNRKVLNLCSNNYLGLANHPAVLRASREAAESRGFGLASVRFICGTQDIHKELEKAVSAFLGTEDTILYSSCFDANAGLFETLLGPDDAVLSDELNHASIIDGIRLCKARKYRYLHADLADLEAKLKEAQDARLRLIATDGVFSMDGDTANLPGIAALAEKYDALLMVDDSHATGCLGKTGRGSAEFHGLQGGIDILTTTFGKALGGASGGCASGRREIIELLRQRSRPYLFSNSLAPGIVGAVLEVLKILEADPSLPAKIAENARFFREGLTALGFTLPPGQTAILPVMLYDEKITRLMADLLLEEGLYVVGFSFPVVPRGKARIRTQVSASHSKEDLEAALAAFSRVGKRLALM